MRESGDTMLTGKVNVDEFTVGGPEKGMQGRSHSSKNKVIIAIELRGRKKKRKIGLAYAQCIDDYSTESIRPFFKKKISESAKIETDGFSSYTPLAKEYDLSQYLSEKGSSFPEIHLIIMNFKSWLRGIHHKCQYRYLQKYLDEFIFRFNRRNSESGIFNTLLKRFMDESPWPLKRIYELNG
jgi:transposase-like protein